MIDLSASPTGDHWIFVLMSWLFGGEASQATPPGPDHEPPGAVLGPCDVHVEMPVTDDATVIRIETPEAVNGSNGSRWLPVLPAMPSLPSISGPSFVLPTFLRGGEAAESEAADEAEAEHSNQDARGNRRREEVHLDGQGEQRGMSGGGAARRVVPELTPLPTPRHGRRRGSDGELFLGRGESPTELDEDGLPIGCEETDYTREIRGRKAREREIMADLAAAEERIRERELKAAADLKAIRERAQRGSSSTRRRRPPLDYPFDRLDASPGSGNVWSQGQLPWLSIFVILWQLFYLFSICLAEEAIEKCVAMDNEVLAHRGALTPSSLWSGTGLWRLLTAPWLNPSLGHLVVAIGAHLALLAPLEGLWGPRSAACLYGGAALWSGLFGGAIDPGGLRMGPFGALCGCLGAWGAMLGLSSHRVGIHMRGVLIAGAIGFLVVIWLPRVDFWGGFGGLLGGYGLAVPMMLYSLYANEFEQQRDSPQVMAIAAMSVACLVVVLVVSIGALLPGLVHPAQAQPGDIFWGGQGREPV